MSAIGESYPSPALWLGLAIGGVKEKYQKIFELEAKLTDKEAQRKELLSFLYKPGKKELEAEMLSAAATLDFERAAKLRDMIQKLP